MDLFVVNRYEGEAAVAADENAGKNHLAELLKKIESRKKARLERGEKKDVEEATARSEEFCRIEASLRAPKKRAKKRRAEANDAAKESTRCVECEESSVNVTARSGEENVRDFTILGTESKKRIKAVQRVLPRWLAQPEIISADLASGPRLDELRDELDAKLVEALSSNGLMKLFPVQASVVRWLLKCNRDRRMGRWPRDTCVSAPTGSGKTLAYVIPVIQHLQCRLVPKIRCLVVLPVQELAAQVYKVFVTYSAHTNLRVGLVTGASSFEAEQSNLVKKSQRGEITSRVDIVVATPGRLIDHIEKTDGFCLKDLVYLVIDEADRSTDWLQYIPPPHSRAPPLTLGKLLTSPRSPAQKLLFSATLSQDPEKLSRLGLLQPILFTSVAISGRDDDVDLDKEIDNFTGRYTSPDELEERAIKCDAEYKPMAVRELLMTNETSTTTIDKTLVFTNSGDAAHRLAILLRSLLDEKSIIVDELSAQLVPKQRADVLGRFAAGHIHVLVSSDALARGLDIPGVKLVIAYDLPKHIEGYIHRAGRTARAGTPGTAVSILTANQTAAFARMLDSAGKAVPTIEELPSLDEIAEEIGYADHLTKLRETLANEKTISTDKGKTTRRRIATRRAK